MRGWCPNSRQGRPSGLKSKVITFTSL